MGAVENAISYNYEPNLTECFLSTEVGRAAMKLTSEDWRYPVGFAGVERRFNGVPVWSLYSGERNYDHHHACVKNRIDSTTIADADLVRKMETARENGLPPGWTMARVGNGRRAHIGTQCRRLPELNSSASGLRKYKANRAVERWVELLHGYNYSFGWWKNKGCVYAEAI